MKILLEERNRINDFLASLVETNYYICLTKEETLATANNITLNNKDRLLFITVDVNNKLSKQQIKDIYCFYQKTKAACIGRPQIELRISYIGSSLQTVGFAVECGLHQIEFKNTSQYFSDNVDRYIIKELVKAYLGIEDEKIVDITTR